MADDPNRRAPDSDVGGDEAAGGVPPPAPERGGRGDETPEERLRRSYEKDLERKTREIESDGGMFEFAARRISQLAGAPDEGVEVRVRETGLVTEPLDLGPADAMGLDAARLARRLAELFPYAGVLYRTERGRLLFEEPHPVAALLRPLVTLGALLFAAALFLGSPAFVADPEWQRIVAAAQVKLGFALSLDALRTVALASALVAVAAYLAAGASFRRTIFDPARRTCLHASAVAGIASEAKRFAFSDLKVVYGKIVAKSAAEIRSEATERGEAIEVGAARSVTVDVHRYRYDVRAQRADGGEEVLLDPVSEDREATFEAARLLAAFMRVPFRLPETYRDG